MNKWLLGLLALGMAVAANILRERAATPDPAAARSEFAASCLRQRGLIPTLQDADVAPFCSCLGDVLFGAPGNTPALQPAVDDTATTAAALQCLDAMAAATPAVEPASPAVSPAATTEPLPAGPKRASAR